MGTLGASTYGAGYYLNHGVPPRNHTTRAMIDYDRRSRPVPEEQRVHLPFHLTKGYLDAVRQLEARVAEPNCDPSTLSRDVEKAVGKLKRA